MKVKGQLYNLCDRYANCMGINFLQEFTMYIHGVCTIELVEKHQAYTEGLYISEAGKVCYIIDVGINAG